MRKNISDNLNITLIYLAVVSVVRFKLDLNLLPFWLGGLIGSVILYSDYFFQVFLVQPELEMSKEAKRRYKTGDYKEVFRYVFDHATEIKSLTFHTILFQVIFTVFAFFIMTSTSSFLGQGIVVGALLSLLTKQYLEIKLNGRLNDDWFSRINVNLPPQSQKIYLLVMAGILVLLTGFIIK